MKNDYVEVPCPNCGFPYFVRVNPRKDKDGLVVGFTKLIDKIWEWFRR